MNNIKDKIKHLLSIAHDPSASEHEREQAMDRAHAWMLKHGIEVAHEEEQMSATFGHQFVDFKGVYAEAQAQMTYFILLSYQSFDMVMHKLPNTSSVMTTIAGPEAQLGEVTSLIDSIIIQSDEERKNWAKVTLRGAPRSEQKRQIKSFYLGYGSRVAERITQILDAEASQQDRQALVLMNEKATKHLSSLYDIDKRRSRKRNVNSNAFAVGQLAGERARLNHQLT